jgi:YbgC/YbaW family acyl-CoA thioester hydrolase
MKVFRSHLKVRSYELDSFGHANHAVFLNYLEQARFEALDSAGFSYGTIQARGWSIHVVKAQIDFLAELKLDDALEIETWVTSYSRTSMVLAQRILRSRKGVGTPVGAPVGTPAVEPIVASRSEVMGVWIGENGRPMRVPAGLKEGLGTPPT